VGPLPPVFFPKFSAGLRIEIFGGDLVRTPHPQNLSLLANFSFLPPPPLNAIAINAKLAKPSDNFQTLWISGDVKISEIPFVMF
jgi:hypothetical protein